MAIRRIILDCAKLKTLLIAFYLIPTSNIAKATQSQELHKIVGPELAVKLMQFNPIGATSLNDVSAFRQFLNFPVVQRQFKTADERSFLAQALRLHDNNLTDQLVARAIISRMPEGDLPTLDHSVGEKIMKARDFYNNEAVEWIGFYKRHCFTAPTPPLNQEVRRTLDVLGLFGGNAKIAADKLSRVLFDGDNQNQDSLASSFRHNRISGLVAHYHRPRETYGLIKTTNHKYYMPQDEVMEDGTVTLAEGHRASFIPSTNDHQLTATRVISLGKPNGQNSSLDVQPQPVSQDAEVTGKVKFYRPKQGFGFITLPDGRDIFVHVSALAPGRILYMNDTVQFRIVQHGENRFKAIDVR